MVLRLHITVKAKDLPKPTPPEILNQLVKDCKEVERLATEEWLYELLTARTNYQQLDQILPGLGLSPFLELTLENNPNIALRGGKYFEVKTPYN